MNDKEREESARISANHILEQTASGQTLAAADHILVRERKEDLPIVVNTLLNEIPRFIESHSGAQKNLFTTLIRIGLNLVGRDAQVAQIPKDAIEKSQKILKEGMVPLEDSYAEVGSITVDGFLAEMWSVNSGDSLPGYMAESIKKTLPHDHKPSSFIEGFGSVARQIVYRKMVEEDYCKFGNDYARGLETLRHLGFSQVSTNPVLAAKAFDEDPNLLEKLKQEINRTIAWKQNPREHAHEMVMAGTLLALWPNLEVFRPLAILVNNYDYMVSFQLNPNVADDAKASLEDAKRAYSLAQEHLTAYDCCLGVPNPGRVRPNIVFKVAASSKVAREVTRQINASGVGTNNTVTFSVSQEVPLMIDALKGKAEATIAGRPVTRTYMTNMGGRFVSHLREEEAKRILLEVASRKGEDEAEQTLMRLAEKLNLQGPELDRVKRASTLPERADIVCSYKNMKSLAHAAFLEAASQADLTHEQVQQLENDLRRAGTLVARRVYLLFYEKSNHERWVDWLERNHQIKRAQAISILNSMDILPASKRIPEDTLDTLASPNMCNTEFPNHARAVQVHSEQHGFDLASFRNAALGGEDSELVKRLTSIVDFAKGYEFTKQVLTVTREAGAVSASDSLRGIDEDGWIEFGPVRKTMNEFKDAYDRFLERCIKIAGS